MTTEYRNTAYESAIFLAVARIAREKFLPHEGEEIPLQKIECEELPRGECSVPIDSVIDVILRLERMADTRKRKLARFKLIEVTEADDEREWEESSAAPARKPEKQVKQAKPKSGSNKETRKRTSATG